MAERSGTKTGTKRKNQYSNKKKTTSTRSKSYQTVKDREHQEAIKNEIILIAILAIAIVLFLCNFGVIGTVGNLISGVLFGVFGLTAYIFPIMIFLAVAFGISNRGNSSAALKLISGIILFILAGMVIEIISGEMMTVSAYDIKAIYQRCSVNRNGGGILAGSIAYLVYHWLDIVGSILMILVLAIVCMVIITERSFLGGVKNGSRKVLESAKIDAERRREENLKRKEEYTKRREEKEIYREQIEQDKKLRMENKISGVMLDTAIAKKEDVHKTDDMHEIVFKDEAEKEIPAQMEFDFDKITVRGVNLKEKEIIIPKSEKSSLKFSSDSDITPKTARVKETIQSTVETKDHQSYSVEKDILKQEGKTAKYHLPPLSLLNKGENKAGVDTAKSLKETALRLQQTLSTFGVKVSITDISQGPAVTRYELQPEQGVKVSKIVNLADDIKLNLAATDIRIEAPIPGKAAIGIEVPNKENSAVALRDLFESTEFKSFPSNITFAVGKDIGGQTVVADIGKMPHMLIAGATGSGKSVCINTLIMGILFKANPEDVKMIMIDPKVVELSVYNGIPHLLIPVVTDPKKAAAALHWGVAEMTDRYKKFADMNVRDLKGYNKKIETYKPVEGEDTPIKMPQIVIIVDELADLMMVAPGEVEESICRLAQLARAAGIHLIIATQRPSVDVITGLIKANMPSRVAFAVSSGVDSRTILDMNGAEKLLGKGDMLFYPQGYAKPARIQGAFVSDKEVADVVDYLKNQAIGNLYDNSIEETIESIGSSQSHSGASQMADERDTYFMEAAKFIIDKDKASIGMLQRVFKIGFNRAARIMDQLAEAGVVGEEEGTKPRKVLMSMEQFENFIEESF